ncbi:c-type cytochrome [Candidatus Leptofilum sp.]|uniref:c-type cytochrome n=1 Tax=Candidatus Leptofilum sp. TaxID=3241576 RepID=UPI003B5A22E3
MTNSANISLLLILVAVALAAIGFMLRPTATTAAQDVPLPIAPPDAAAGLAIYNERCSVCHGELGDGLGVQAVQAGLEPAAFSNPSYRVTAVPATMFDVINNGNISAGMPPFGSASSSPLNDADIWNLVALAYSFSTRPDDIAAGEALAAELEADTTTWPGLDYWFGRSNEAILAELESENILSIDVSGLSDEEKLWLIDYGRSLNYSYTDPLAAFAPVPLGIINGQVINGTTNEALTEGEVRLRAFTTQLEEMYTETVSINEDGSFEFQLEDVPADWVFLADVTYGDLTFNSNAVQLSNAQPEAQMPLFVFETTADPAAITIDRLHMIFTFGEERLIVSELYVFSNREAAVFVGESGDFNQGTVEIGLPTGAENISFQRGFGTSLDSFIPATDFIRTETGWADVNPLQPGAGSLNLIVNYDLPYNDGMLLAHPLAYQVTSGATVIMADAGVQIADERWVSQGEQATAGGSFVSYVNNDLANADAISLTLDGRPSQIFDAQGNALPVRNETNELIVGGAALAGMLAVGFFLVQRWRTAPVGQGSAGSVSQPAAAPPRPVSANRSQKHDLLEAIADLDDAYDAGELDEAAYQTQRQALKSRLTAVWQS